MLLVPFNARNQDLPYAGGHTERIAQASSLISSGCFTIASALLDQLRQEVVGNYPPDSVTIADIAYLAGNLSLLRDDPWAALNRYREARAYATGVLQLSRIDQNTGSAFFMVSDYEKATRYYSHALAELEYSGTFISSRMLSLYDNLGAASYESGNLEAAGNWWEMAAGIAVSHFPSDSILLAKLFNNSGLVSFGRGEWTSSTAFFLQAMQLIPGNTRPFDRMNMMIRKNLAISLMKEGKSGEAEKMLAIFRTDDPVFCLSDPVLCAEILRMHAWTRFSSGRMSEVDSLLGEASELTYDTRKVDSFTYAQIEQFRIQRDRAAMLYLQSTDDDLTDVDKTGEIYEELLKAICMLRPFRSPDSSFPDFILLHDSIDVLLRRTVETGFRLLASRPGIAGDLLWYTGLLSSRHFRADAFGMKGDGDVWPDSMTDAWLQLNRQIYLHRKMETESPLMHVSSDPHHETRRFRLENELDSLTRFLREQYPGKTRAVDSMEPDVAALTSRLSDEEAILDYMVAPGSVYIFVARNDGVTLARSVTDTSFRNSFNELLVDLRTADDLSFRKENPSVSDVLINPILPFLDGIHRLYIIPGRELEGLPFECLLMDGSGYLPEQFAITYHLSLTEVTTDRYLIAGRTLAKPETPGGFLAFSPAFSENQGMQRIGNAADEVNEIGMIFSTGGYSSKIYTGEEADESTLLREVRNSSIVHIATHAKVNRRYPEQTGIYLWKRPPPAAGDELIDGILEMGEVKGLRFRCSLLTLSSCTLGPWGLPGERYKPCLQGEFLDAGAQRILYSLWNVSDRHTRTLMVDFYRFYLEGDDFAEALRKAKVKMLKNPATASPYFWSAFILGAR